MSDKVREDFEAWAKEPPREWVVNRCLDDGKWPGQYTSYLVQCTWEAWQEAWKPAEIDRLRAVNAKLVEALEDIASGEIGINLCIKYARQALAEASK